MFKENSDDFINKSSIGIHTVSALGVIEYANQFELDMLGYSKDEYVGHHVSEFQIDENILNDMMCRLNDLRTLENYPSRVKGKKELKYILYNSSVYLEDEQFVHTRCYGCEIDEGVYKAFIKSS